MNDDDLDSLKTSGEELKGIDYGNSKRLSVDLIKKIMDFSTIMKENMFSSSVILRLKSGTNSSTRRCTAGRTVLQGVKNSEKI